MQAVAGFPKNGVNVTARGIKIAEGIIGTDLYVTCIDGLIIELISWSNQMLH